MDACSYKRFDVIRDSIKDEFEKRCHWVLSKMANTFSSIPIEQAHEQENDYVKESGGCIGLTNNPCWMLSGHELARLQKQFEDEYLYDYDMENPKYQQNHEQGLSTQKTFQRQVQNRIKTIQTMGKSIPR